MQKAKASVPWQFYHTTIITNARKREKQNGLNLKHMKHEDVFLSFDRIWFCCPRLTSVYKVNHNKIILSQKETQKPTFGSSFFFDTKTFLALLISNWKRCLEAKALRVTSGQGLCLVSDGLIQLSACLSFSHKPIKQGCDLRGPMRIYYIHNNVQCTHLSITHTQTNKHMCGVHKYTNRHKVRNTANRAKCVCGHKHKHGVTHLSSHLPMPSCRKRGSVMDLNKLSYWAITSLLVTYTWHQKTKNTFNHCKNHTWRARMV